MLHLPTQMQVLHYLSLHPTIESAPKFLLLPKRARSTNCAAASVSCLMSIFFSPQLALPKEHRDDVSGVEVGRGLDDGQTKKRLAIVWEPLVDMRSRTEPYPDQAGLYISGDGNGFSMINAIIHDFLCYNKRMERDIPPLIEKSVDSLHLELLHLLAHQASAVEMPLYLVGGVVRDILLGRAINDFDLVVEGDTSVLAEFIVKKYGGKILVHSRFGTAKWILNESAFKRLNFPVSRFPDFDVSFDLVTARSET